MNYVFMAIVIICGVLDFKTRTIPNKITIPLAALGLIYQIVVGHLYSSLAGLLIGFSIGLVSFALNGMGGGDVKLMAALGAWLGPVPFLFVLFTASIIGVIWGFILYLRRKILFRKLKEIALKVSLVYYNSLTVKQFVQADESESNKQHLSIPFGACLSLALIYMQIYPIQN